MPYEATRAITIEKKTARKQKKKRRRRSASSDLTGGWRFGVLGSLGGGLRGGSVGRVGGFHDGGGGFGRRVLQGEEGKSVPLTLFANGKESNYPPPQVVL